MIVNNTKAALLGIAAATGLAGPSAVLAQDTETAPAPEAAAPCELHIWGSSGFSSLPFGNGLSGALSVMFPGNLGAGTDEQFQNIATVELQIEAIKRADPVASLGLPQGTTIISHEETEEDRTTKKREERRSDSAVECYYELHIRSNYLIEDIVWGDRFATTFDFRRYTDEPKWSLRHRGEGGNKLTVFPVKPEDDLAEVIREVSEAIEANFVEYAPKAKRKLERKKRRR